MKPSQTGFRERLNKISHYKREVETYKEGYIKGQSDKEKEMLDLIDNLDVNKLKFIKFRKPYYQGKEELKERLQKLRGGKEE